MVQVQYGFSLYDLPIGWQVHYEAPYNNPTTLADVLPPTGKCMLWAAKPCSSCTVFSALAFADRERVANYAGNIHWTEPGPPLFDHGTFWYWTQNWSAGFASTDNIALTNPGPYDTALFDERSRVSWRLDGYGGWRAGTETYLQNNDQWQKVVMYGPQPVRCTPEACDVGYVMRPEFDLPNYCMGLSCPNDLCCEPADRCGENFTCFAGMSHLTPDRAPEYCQSTVCQQSECCEVSGRCHEGVCAVRHNVVLKFPEDQPAWCARRNCTFDECCDAAPNCTQDVCPRGYGVRIPTPYCQTHACQSEECCDPVPRCNRSDCNFDHRWTPKQDFDVAVLECQRVICAVEECCDRLPPSASVPLASFVDLDPDANQLGGYIMWRAPPDAFVDMSVSNFNLYIGPSPWRVVKNQVASLSSAGVTPIDVPESVIVPGSPVPWGQGISPFLTTYSLPIGLPIGPNFSYTFEQGETRFLYIETSNAAGSQVTTPLGFTVQDWVAMPRDVVFEDLDLDAGEIAGQIYWRMDQVDMAGGDQPSFVDDLSDTNDTQPQGGIPDTIAIITSFDVFIATRTNPKAQWLGTVPGNHNRTTYNLTVPLNTRFLNGATQVNVFARSTLQLQDVPGSTTFHDRAASVSNIALLDFTFDPGAATLGGIVEWDEPRDMSGVIGYRLYLSKKAMPVEPEDRTLLGDSAPGSAQVVLGEGTALPENVTHILIYTVSTLSEQSIPRAEPLTNTGYADIATLVALSVGAAAVGRVAASTAAATATGVNAGPQLDGFERAGQKVDKKHVDSTPIEDQYESLKNLTIEIKSIEMPVLSSVTQTIRASVNSVAPVLMHQHPEKITVVHGTGDKKERHVLYRHHKCDNVWDNGDMIVERLSQCVVSVYGGGQPYTRLKRRRNYCRGCLNWMSWDVALRACAPLLSIIVISTVIMGTDTWVLGLMLGLMALLGLCVVFCAKPSSALSRSIEAIKNCPPKSIREQFWKTLGLLVAILPCAPAFLSQTVIGYVLGTAAVVGGLLTYVGLPRLAYQFELFVGAVGGTVFLVLRLTGNTQKEKEDARIMPLFLAGALMLVKGIDGMMQDKMALYDKTALDEDDIVSNAARTTHELGVEVCKAMALEAYCKARENYDAEEGRLKADSKNRVPKHMHDRLLRGFDDLIDQVTGGGKVLITGLQKEIFSGPFSQLDRSLERSLVQIQMASKGIDLASDELAEQLEELESRLQTFLDNHLSEKMFGKCQASIMTVEKMLTIFHGRLTYIADKYAGNDVLGGPAYNWRAATEILSFRARQLALQAHHTTDDCGKCDAGGSMRLRKVGTRCQLLTELLQRTGEAMQMVEAAVRLDAALGTSLKQGEALASGSRVMDLIKGAWEELASGKRALVEVGKVLKTKRTALSESDAKQLEDYFHTLEDCGEHLVDLRKQLRSEEQEENQEIQEAVDTQVEEFHEEQRQFLATMTHTIDKQGSADEDFLHYGAMAIENLRITVGTLSRVASEIFALKKRGQELVEHMEQLREDGIKLHNGIMQVIDNIMSDGEMDDLGIEILTGNSIGGFIASAARICPRAEDIATEALLLLEKQLHEEIQRARHLLECEPGSPVSPPHHHHGHGHHDNHHNHHHNGHHKHVTQHGGSEDHGRDRKPTNETETGSPKSRGHHHRNHHHQQHQKHSHSPGQSHSRPSTHDKPGDNMTPEPSSSASPSASRAQTQSHQGTKDATEVSRTPSHQTGLRRAGSYRTSTHTSDGLRSAASGSKLNDSPSLPGALP